LPFDFTHGPELVEGPKGGLKSGETGMMPAEDIHCDAFSPAATLERGPAPG